MRRRWRIVLALAAFCLVIGLFSWNDHQRRQRFVGDWLLQNSTKPNAPPRSISSLTSNGSTNQLMWHWAPETVKSWVGPDWWLRGDYLYLERPGGTPRITSTLSFVTYWMDRLLGRGSQTRLRVLEITPTRMRLSDETLGAMPSVYDRVAPVE